MQTESDEDISFSFRSEFFREFFLIFSLFELINLRLLSFQHND